MVKPPHKMTKLIVSAIRNLRDVQGSTTKDILNYVMKEYNSEPSMERRLRAALKRGLEYGILQKKGGHYLLNTDTEILDQGPMERGRRRRRRKKRGGKRLRKARGRKRRRGARRARGRSRVRRARRRGSRRIRRHTRGKITRKRTGTEEIDMMTKEPLEAPGPHLPIDGVVGQTYERPRSRSRSQQSRQSRSPSRSSGSSDRDATDGRRPTD
ncbi:hypothetical protein PV326_011107 [Microctonus aethiopoides]|uniref:H15 domain-containing protein n=1 Tax=Microctonus aethiopoides TaxID=144406 RepID=A0AA39FXM1_9HYME|nr:hypothetical protein PV326_011107 [Microctonus aethiopoides]KAK0177720.1 hypothetical protein PV328_001742 [Microctonus aethiopoides]